LRKFAKQIAICLGARVFEFVGRNKRKRRVKNVGDKLTLGSGEVVEAERRRNFANWDCTQTVAKRGG